MNQDDTSSPKSYGRIIEKCRCCNGDDLHRYLSLGEQPLANSYGQREGVPTFPLELMLCSSCFHTQLSVEVDPALMFTHYDYVSGTTETLKNHFWQLAKSAILGTGIHGFPLRVLDIGANDGTLLEQFLALDGNCQVLGVDPAENLREITKAKGIDVIVDFWGINTVCQLKSDYDVITACNVFAHTPNHAGFLEACRQALSPNNGVLIIEFPYGKNTIKENQTGQFYAEHASAFLVNSFSRLASRCGFYINKVVESPIHGGSIRFYLKVGLFGHCQDVRKLILEEKQMGLLSYQAYNEFRKQVESNKAALVALVASVKRKGFKIVAYGAAAKATTDFNYFGLGPTEIDYVVDDNPIKVGKCMPNSSLMIRPSSNLKDEGDNLCLIIPAWNFLDEIKKRVKTSRPNRKTSYIVYVPKVSMEEL